MDLKKAIDDAYAGANLSGAISSAYDEIQATEKADREALVPDLMGMGYGDTPEEVMKAYTPGYRNTSTLGKVVEAAPMKVAAGGLEAARAAMSPLDAIPAVNKARRYIADAIQNEVDPYGATGNQAADYALEALKSTSQSVALMLAGGGVGGIPGAIIGKGVLYGTNEYADFMDEVKDIAIKSGMSDKDVSKKLSDARIPGIVSGLAEMGGEVLSDVLGARILGLVGAPVKEVGKSAAKMLARGAGAVGSEVLGEEGTTAVQHFARQAAGLHTESLVKEMLDTAAVSGIQAGMMVPIGAGMSRRNRAKLAERLEATGVDPAEAKTVAADVIHAAETKGDKAAEEILWKKVEEQKVKDPTAAVISSVIEKVVADANEPGRVYAEGLIDNEPTGPTLSDLNNNILNKLSPEVRAKVESIMGYNTTDFYDDYTEALRVKQDVDVLAGDFGLRPDTKLFDLTPTFEKFSKGEDITKEVQDAKGVRSNEGQLPPGRTTVEEGKDKGGKNIQLVKEQREEGVQGKAVTKSQRKRLTRKERLARVEKGLDAVDMTAEEVKAAGLPSNIINFPVKEITTMTGKEGADLISGKDIDTLTTGEASRWIKAFANILHDIKALGKNVNQSQMELVTERHIAEVDKWIADNQDYINRPEKREVIARGEEESKAEGQTQRTEVLNTGTGQAVPHVERLAQALFDDDLTGVIMPDKDSAEAVVNAAGADRFQMTMHGADYVVLPIGSVVGKKEKATIRRLQTKYIKDEIESVAVQQKEEAIDYVPMSHADIKAGLSADTETNEGLVQNLTAKIDSWFRGKRNGAGYQDLEAEINTYIDEAKGSKWEAQLIDLLRRLELAREAAGNPDQLSRILLNERGSVDVKVVMDLGIKLYNKIGHNVQQWLAAMKQRAGALWNKVKDSVFMVRNVIFDQEHFVSLAVPFKSYGQGSLYFATTPDTGMILPNYAYSITDAMAMQRQGASDMKILEKTGFQKIHEWWFYRVPTADVVINWGAVTNPGLGIKLKDLVDIPDVYSKIPGLADIMVYVNKYSSTLGVYDHSRKSITLREYDTIPLMHELQHAIQNFQGTAIGSSPLYEYYKLVKAIVVTGTQSPTTGALLLRATTKEDLDTIIKEHNYVNSTKVKVEWGEALNNYSNSLGEIMANAAMHTTDDYAINVPIPLDKPYIVRIGATGSEYWVDPTLLPQALHHRVTDTANAIVAQQALVRDAIAQNTTIIDKRPKDISAMRQWFMHSINAVSSDVAKRLVFSVTQAEKLFNVRVQNELDMKDRIVKHLDKEERIQVMTLGNKVSRDMQRLRRFLEKNEMEPAQVSTTVAAFKEWAIEQYAPTAKVAAAYSAIDRTIYQKYRKMIKANLLRELRFHTKPSFIAAIDTYGQLVTQGIDETAALITAISQHIGNDAVQLRKFGAVMTDYIKNAVAIDSWGDDDYWSHFMRGNLVLKNKDGRIVTVAQTPKQASERIQAYADEHPNEGPYSMDDSFMYADSLPTLVGKRHYLAIKHRLAEAVKTVNSELGKVEANQKVGLALRKVLGTKPASVFAGPLLTTRNILPGEEDIDTVLSAYIQIVTKKLTFDPVIWQVRRDIDQLPPNERNVVEDALADGKGKYSEADKVFDALVRTLFPNTKGRNLSRAVSNSRTLTAALKLGYRPIASMLNAIDATTRVWIDLHEQAMARGIAWMNTPTGKQVIDEWSWALGARPFEESGHFTGGIRFLGHNWKGWTQIATPLGMYNIAEFPARKLNFAVAYTQAVKDGLTDVEAAEFAIKSVDMLQGANVISALPKLMRNPVGRAFTLFMPFVVRTVEWIATNANNPQFWGRFLPYMLAVGGPRGLAMMLKSLPVIALLAVFMGKDRIEEWYLEVDEWLQRKLGGLASGLPGLFGADIVAPATIQLPTEPEQWAGAVTSTILKGSMDATKAIFSYNRAASLKDIAKKQAPFVRNVWDVIDAIYDDYGNVRDANGDIRYNLNNNYDKAMVLVGAKPVAKSYEDTATRLNKLAKAREIKVKDDILDWASNQLTVLTRKGFTSSDLPDSFYEKLSQRMAEHNITAKSLEERVERSQKTKTLEAVLRSDKMNRLDLYNRVEEAGQAFGTNFLQPQR